MALDLTPSLRRVASWVHLCLAACAVLPAAHAGPVPVHQAVSEVPPNEAPIASQLSGATSAVAAGPGSDAPSAPQPLREVEWLLDLQVEKIDLGVTPIDPAGASQMSATADLRLLAADLPANPLFPGYGLSFVLPSGPVRAPISEARLEAMSNAPDQPRVAGGPGSTGAQGHGLDPVMAARLGTVRSWVAAHRVELLFGLGAAALLLALVGARTSKTAPASSARHRRRRRRHSADQDSARRTGRATQSPSA